MRNISFTFILALICQYCFAQNNQKIDSLKLELTRATSDTMRVLIYEKLMNTVPKTNSNDNERIEFGLQGFNLAKRIRYNKGIILCGSQVAFALAHQEYYRAIPICMEIKRVAEISNDKEGLAFALFDLGYAYGKFDKQKGLSYFYSCKNLIEREGLSENRIPISISFGLAYMDDKKHLDSALFYVNKSYQLALKSKSYQYRPVQHFRHFGRIYYNMGKLDLAMNYFRQAITSSAYQEEPGFCDRYMALIFRDRNQLDSAKFYAQKSLKAMQIAKTNFQLVETTNLLCELYKNDNPAKVLQYLLLGNAVKDSLFSQDKIRQANRLALEEQDRELRTQRRIEVHQTEFENKVKIYALSALLLGLSLFAIVLYRNNKNKQKANTLLHTQKEEIDLQREKAEKAFVELKSTQNQLIQAEKMASLGELTAGIAHEIQNPLNFVNNFSEMSVELAHELNEEIDKEAIDKDLVREILSDLTQNQQKINHHGKRASSIVKGMLEHSRTSTGVKELTDINALADEYLRLAYHGLRAKDKSFNCDFKTDFDENLPKIEVIPQDFGRVLLNLINNAFYAVSQRKNLQAEASDGLADLTGLYTPRVIVSTEQIDNQIVIKVKDNGIGMPEATKAKIFQPFFTTKPTGQGTGLGLSLAYDIITKGHGGTLEVMSKEGEGSEFIITLPMKTN